MNLVNQKVEHKQFGIGSVTKVDNNHVIVAFADKKKMFRYPYAFEKFLTATDDSINQSILLEIQALKRAKKNTFKQIARQIQERKKPSQKRFVGDKRVAGENLTFYVFQRETFDRESKGGYLWAPIANEKGNTFHYWERLQTVRAGDIMIHDCNNEIVAISQTKGRSYQANEPSENEQENAVMGQKIDCEYVVLKKPVKTATLHEDILKHSRKYSPFNRNGKGNNGYLYDLDQELAKIFVRRAVKENPDIAAHAFLEPLLKGNAK